MNQSLHILVTGRVQGVGFRYFTQQTAESLGLTGWVRNLPGGEVEITAQGDEKEVKRFISRIKLGPPASLVEKIHSQKKSEATRYNHFYIR